MVCKIYYATVVDSAGFKWAQQGDHMMEPVRVEGREPLGKQPKFCCEELRDANNESRSCYFHSDENGMNLRLYSLSTYSINIHFCPFCGSLIIFKENLKLKVLETTHSVRTYHYEEA